jgi:serine/threonine protein kinase
MRPPRTAAIRSNSGAADRTPVVFGEELSGSPLNDIFHQLQAALADRYRLERELGRGGMATVYLAEDLKHRRQVAVKVLRPELATSLGPERFLREIRVTAQLQHPHILPVLDSGELSGFLWYTMPRVAGEALRSRLMRERQLPIEDAILIAQQVASALGHAHGHGIIHRDIKPENILLDGDQAVVADFGIARALTAAGGEKLTETGLSIGTPAYMSPEQASGSQDVDARSDLYSLGCVLYEMLAGQPPFTAPSAQGLMARHALDPVPSLRTVRATVPPEIERAVKKALAKVPADRFATAEQFAAALIAPRTTAAVSSERAARRLRWLVPAAGFIGLAGAAAIIWPKLQATSSQVIPSASVIAVLPLSPSVADTGLQRLGRDLVLTLSPTLDGVGGIRTVDAHTVLAQTSTPAVKSSLDRDRALGRALGAGSVLHGSVLRVGPNVRLDVGLFTSDSGTSLARASVTAPPDSIEALTNGVIWSLLPQIWRRGTPPSPSLDGALRTKSIGALRAFLEGERALVENRWDDATEAYGLAIEADSAFWLAYARYAYILEWRNRQMDSTMMNALMSHRGALPERERLLLGTSPADDVSAVLARTRQLSERFPSNWFARMAYADKLVHWGPMLGHTRAEARAALEETLRLNPRFVPAWEHLVMKVLGDHDTLASTRVLNALTRLGSGPAFQEERGSDRLLQFRLIDQLQRGDAARARVLADSVVRDVAASGSLEFESPGIYSFLAQEIALRRQTLQLGMAPDKAVVARRMIAYSWASRGAWDSALIAMDQSVKSGAEIDSAGPLRAYRLAVLGAWLGALPPERAAERRASALKAVGQLGEKERAEAAWLDGMLAVSRGDRRALATAREAARSSGDSNAAVLDKSLAAFDLYLGQAKRQAGEALARLEWQQTEQWYPHRFAYPALMAIDRLAASEWLLDVGDTTQAARLLTWIDADIGGMGFTSVVAGLADLERARIEEARGHPDLAREHYEEFLLRYDMPVPAHRHLVRGATEALARLSGRRDEPREPGP